MKQLDLCQPPQCAHTSILREGGGSSRCADCGEWLSSRFESERRKREGIELVLANESQEWKLRALRCALNLARSQVEFTSDDLRDACIRDGLGEPHHMNMWGGLFHSIRGDGIAIPTDKSVLSERPDAHRRRIPVWRSLIHA